jgi:hypothetical protein
LIWFGGRIRAVIHPTKGTVLAEQEIAQTDTKELTERELQEEFDAELMIESAGTRDVHPLTKEEAAAMPLKIAQSLDIVDRVYEEDETRDWAEDGFPNDHIARHLIRLRH